MVLSRQSKAKWPLTAVADFTPKELGEPSAANSEVSKMSMTSVFLAVSGWLPQLLGSENAIAFKDTREGEEKKDQGEGKA
jgi:hypothetical protein